MTVWLVKGEKREAMFFRREGQELRFLEEQKR